jgi:hypothetical protein
MIPKVSSPEVRACSLAKEQAILSGIQHDLTLSPEARSRLPRERRFMLEQFVCEGRKK